MTARPSPSSSPIWIASAASWRADQSTRRDARAGRADRVRSPGRGAGRPNRRHARRRRGRKSPQAQPARQERPSPRPYRRVAHAGSSGLGVPLARCHDRRAAAGGTARVYDLDPQRGPLAREALEAVAKGTLTPRGVMVWMGGLTEKSAADAHSTSSGRQADARPASTSAGTSSQRTCRSWSGPAATGQPSSRTRRTRRSRLGWRRGPGCRREMARPTC